MIAFLVLTHMHAPDVDLVLAQRGPDAADGAGSILIEDQQNMSFGDQFQPEIVDLDDFDVAAPDDSAGHDVFTVSGANPQGDQVGVVLGFGSG